MNIRKMNSGFWAYLAGSAEGLDLKDKNVVLAVLIYSLGFLTIYPILINPLDLWDGAIIDYAFTSDLPRIFKTWFLESGWPLVEYLYLAVYYLSEALSVDGSYVINIVMFASLILSGREIFLICNQCFNIPSLPALIGLLLYYFNPALPVNLSSVFLMHSVFIYMCLLGARLYLSGGAKKAIFGIFLVTLSFQHNSNPMLFLFILVCSLFFSPRRKVFLDTVVLICLAAIFLCFREFFPAHGLYSNYNVLNLYNVLNYNLWEKYIPFYNLFFSMLTVSLLVVFVQNPEKMYRVVLAFVGIILNIIPYVLVGKFPNLNDMHQTNGWSFRFASTLFVAISIFLPIFLYFTIKYANRLAVVLVSISIMSVFYNYSHSLFMSYASKSKALVYQSLFVDKISEVQNVRPGNLYVAHDSHHPSFYETNYYFYRAFGAASWMALSDESITDLGVTYNLTKYKDKYVLSDYRRVCDTRISVDDNLDTIPNRDFFVLLYSGYIPNNGAQFTMNIDKEEIRCL